MRENEGISFERGGLYENFTADLAKNPLVAYSRSG